MATRVQFATGFRLRQRAKAIRARFLLVGTIVGISFIAHAQNIQHLSITQPGGMPGMPVLTGVEILTNSVKVTWDGPSGYYQLFKHSLTQTNWQAVGTRTNLQRFLSIPGTAGGEVFRVLGPAPNYAGAQACAECHGNIHNTEKFTGHASAFTNKFFVAAGGQTNANCLPCHTTGYGLATGFTSKSDPKTYPRLAGVQCESCHGPAANHAANPDDPITRPRIELAGQVCGGCHTGSHQPTFDEWKTTGHFQVVEDMNDPGRIETCGRCHSGSSRLAQLNGMKGNVLTNAITGDANMGITCAVCHNPHKTRVSTNVLNGVITFRNPITGQTAVFTNSELGRVYTNQLRNPVASTNDFFLTTTDVFTNKYDPNVNACAQCHNHRGASWTSNSRPPHHSPQYNFMIGTVGLLDSGSVTNLPGTHSRIEKQCASCHMQTSAHQNGPPEVAANTGHTFAVDSYNTCAKCHKSASNAAGLVTLAKTGTSYQIQTLKSWLDIWALTKAPAELTSYGTRAWEYDFVGTLTDPTGTLRGPPSNSDLTKDKQHFIPANIRKARFNLYLVAYDGSYGIHNDALASKLLEAAQNWVLAEINN